jgi:hypothetical protein
LPDDPWTSAKNLIDDRFAVGDHDGNGDDEVVIALVSHDVAVIDGE